MDGDRAAVPWNGQTTLTDGRDRGPRRRFAPALRPRRARGRAARHLGRPLDRRPSRRVARRMTTRYHSSNRGCSSGGRASRCRGHANACANLPTRIASANVVLETAAPRLQIRVAQPREPRVGRRQLVDLLEEAERHDERREGMRDRRVAPVEQAQPLALLSRRSHGGGRRAESSPGRRVRRARRTAPRSGARTAAADGSRRCSSGSSPCRRSLVARRQRRDAQVRNAVCELVVRVRSFAALELGVAAA